MKQTSLQGDLGKWLLIIVAVFGVTGTLISFALAYAQAKDLQDDFLEQIGTWLRAGHTIETRSLLYDFDDEQIIIQPWRPSGRCDCRPISGRVSTTFMVGMIPGVFSWLSTVVNAMPSRSRLNYVKNWHSAVR